MRLAEMDAAPFAKNPTLLSSDEVGKLCHELPAWRVVDGKVIERTYELLDFKSALAFVNRVGELAERANHHPNIDFTWGKATLRLSTHDVGGLTKADFIVAAQIEAMAPPPPAR